MRKKVQGHLIQARFIEIHQGFAKKVGYFSNIVVYVYMYLSQKSAALLLCLYIKWNKECACCDISYD